MRIFSKSNYLLKRACKRLFIRPSLVFAFGLIRYSYRTSEIYMYGRDERPFFGCVCFSSRKTIDTLKHMERVRMIQYIGMMQDLLHI